MPAHIIEEPLIIADPVPLLTQSTPHVPSHAPVVMSQCYEEVVISGIACRLPQADNMREFRDNLIEGVDMVTEDETRWTPGQYGLPKRSGKLKDLSKFDASFFGVHPKQANSMDPQLRMLMEVTYEAMVDAGVNPDTVRGSRTGVFIGASASESHDAWSSDPETTVGYSMTGCTRSMFANRLSFFFDFKGPSYTVDTACSSSLLALDQALHSIRTGLCTAAIVGGSNLCLKPAVAAQFMKLGMLSPDGMCKSFDAEGNGYCRSEGIVAIYLQKESVAKRLYCTLLHSKTNSDGNKHQGITFPSGEVQKQLLQEVYTEACIDPATVAYVEAHGTGTKAGDPQEVNTICDVFCKGRMTPLPIGSVKSNMGHSEPCSGLAAVAKVIVAMEEGRIPGNLHYNSPNLDIPGLSNGQLKVINQTTNWNGGTVGVNSFGFGGSNVHSVLKSNTKSKKSSNLSDSSKSPDKCQGCEKKRLFVYGSRSDSGVKATLEEIRKYPDDLHLHSLMQETSHSPASTHPYRGFTILNGSDSISVQKASTEKRPVWFVFAGMGTQWHGMGRQMMEVDVFHSSIMRSDAVLKPYNINLYTMLMEGEENTFENTINSFVGIAAIQVALVDVLLKLGITPDGIVGHSVGELGCAYADGSLSATETVLAAYWRGHCIQNANLPPGGMAAVGLTWKEALDQCPPGIVPACHNATDTVTISGPQEAVREFVQQLKDRNVFAKEVNSAGVAFHSYYMMEIASVLKTALDRVIKSPRPRTSRWVSSSIPEDRWTTDLARFSSADYHVNNLISPVLFQEALQHVPQNAVVVEIAPHCLLQAVLKRSLAKDCCIVGLMKRGHEDNLEFCLSSLGKCYQYGVKLNPLNLLPPVSYPVPPGTPMVSPLVQWEHSQSWSVPTAEMFLGGGSGGASGCGFDVDMSPDSEDYPLIGHKIDGRVLFPATGYLCLAWKTFAKLQGKTCDEMAVTFEDVTIHRATILPDSSKVHFDVTLMAGSGNFEIQEGGAVVSTGRITSLDAPGDLMTSEPATLDHDPAMFDLERSGFELKTGDVYKELRLRGYDYGPTFQGIVGADITGAEGYLRWTGDWVSYMDTMLQMTILSRPGQGLRLPTRIKSLTVDPALHASRLMETSDGNQGTCVHVDQYCDTCTAGGVTIRGLHATTAPRRHDYHMPVLETYTFVPHTSRQPCPYGRDLQQYANNCSRRALHGLQEILESPSGGVVKDTFIEEVVKYTKIDDVKRNINDTVHKGYLGVLEQIFEQQNSTISTESIESTIKSNLDNLQSDQMLNYLLQTEYLKPCLDLVIENTLSLNMKILELGDTRMFHHIAPLLSMHPLLQPVYSMATKAAVEPPEGVEVIKWSLADKLSPSMKKSHLILANNTLHKSANISAGLCNILEALEDGGFILIHEQTNNFHLGIPLDGMGKSSQTFDDLSDRTCAMYCCVEKWREIISNHGLEIVYERADGFLSSLFLVRKKCAIDVGKQRVLDVSDTNCEWVGELKSEVALLQSRPKGENLWLVANMQTSGIMGMVNCLRQEPGGERIRCIFNMSGSDTHISTMLESVCDQDLVINVYKEGQWGTYRHVPLIPATHQTTDDAFVNVMTRGDLSSLCWIQSPRKPVTSTSDTSTDRCRIHYASLNFRDVMLATGKLPPDAIPGGLANQDCLLGMEFSGHSSEGQRVMGLVPAKGLATSVDVNKNFLWTIPDTWSLQDAATVPVVYTTAYYALVVRGNLRHGDRVLVHSGSGGVGQAAISIALHHGCEVFTTVGSAEKKAYLKQRFPQLSDGHFFNSRDTSFENGILKATKGKGVDIVLNSLAEEKLQASLRVLAQHGRFLEIGKFDLSNNTALGMALFLKNISFHGILLDALFEAGNQDWQIVSQHLKAGIQSGAVKPLQTTVFPHNEVEAAFRFMAQGKHIGKVLVQVQPNESSVRSSMLALPRSSCDPGKAYIITGGLGGFGLELAQWLIDRGARCLVLTSRSGVRTGYQARKIKYFKSCGVDVIVSTRNVSCMEDAVHLVTETNNRPVGGVFHLAMVLQDGYLENLDLASFQRVCEPKVTGTLNLDLVTRETCNESCDWFVVFSSVSCGRGNAGQSNYGFANSVMERVCEDRRRKGLHGLAIQWGAIGDVGVVLETMGSNDTVIGGTLPQRITSCLATLDNFLCQSQPVVSSFVPAEKQTTSGPGDKLDLVHVVCHILGVSDPSTVDPNASLGDLGLDSMMSVEVKQTLERGFDISMSTRDIRQLTVNKLATIAAGKGPCDSTEVKAESQGQDSSSTTSEVTEEELMPTQLLIKLNDNSLDLEPLYIIHPIEGVASRLYELASSINRPVFGVQCTQQVPLTSVMDMAQYYLQEIHVHNNNRPFHLAGYSFGACVAIEMAFQAGHSSPSSLSTLSLLDGSHKFVAAHTGSYREHMTITDNTHAETVALCNFLEKFVPDSAQKLSSDLMSAPSLEARLAVISTKLHQAVPGLSSSCITAAAHSFYRKLVIAEEYNTQGRCVVDLDLVLAMGSDQSKTLGEDYGLKEICDGELRVHKVTGDHVTFLAGNSGKQVAAILELAMK